MEELTKVFNNTVLPIEVINKKEFLVDVSGIAKSYGKNLSDWQTKETEYIRLLEKDLKLENPNFKRTLISTKQGRGGFTKIHNSMLISYTDLKRAVNLLEQEYGEE